MGVAKGTKMVRWNEAQKNFLREHYPNHSAAEITKMLNKRFHLKRNVKQIQSAAKRFGIRSGRTGQFEPGHKPNPNAGCKTANRTSFKKGNKPHSWNPIGHERWHGTHHKYLQRKITDTGNTVKDYVEVHRLLWREHNGPIPENHVVIFRDSNRENIQINNLMLVSRADHVCLCKMGFYDGVSETKDAALLLVQIHRKRKQLLKNS
jgi:hypothetical protein